MTRDRRPVTTPRPACVAIALLLATCALSVHAATSPGVTAHAPGDATAHSPGDATAQGDTAHPGGIAVLPLPAGTTGAFAWLAERARPLLRIDGHAYVPVPLDTPPGAERAVAQTAHGSFAVAYRIVDRAYPEQRLHFDEPRMVDPNPADLERIAREQLLIDAARERFDGPAPPALRFAAPARGPLSSPFGTRRVLNGKPRNRHNGLDFAAPLGAAVSAPLAGEVAAVGDWFFTGNTVIVDHGQGLTTMYCHLSRVDVAPGARLQAGDPIGAVGATGRATGPHLHWAVYLSNVPVDPLPLLDAPAEPE